jgi:hypothetical protein
MAMKRSFLVGLFCIPVAFGGLVACSTDPDTTARRLDRLQQAEQALSLACNVALPLAKSVFDSVTVQVDVSDADKQKAQESYALAQAGCANAQAILASVKAAALPPQQ